MKRLLLLSLLFLPFLVSSGLLLSLLGPLGLADNAPIVAVLLAIVFQVGFIGTFTYDIRKLLHPEEPVLPHAAGMVASFSFLILTFAWVYHIVGIVDSTMAAPTAVYDFGTTLYFSIITMSTVGYGELYPRGVGRAMAAVQGLGGYVILGILVSSGFSLSIARLGKLHLLDALR